MMFNDGYEWYSPCLCHPDTPLVHKPSLPSRHPTGTQTKSTIQTPHWYTKPSLSSRHPTGTQNQVYHPDTPLVHKPSLPSRHPTGTQNKSIIQTPHWYTKPSLPSRHPTGTQNQVYHPDTPLVHKTKFKTKLSQCCLFCIVFHYYNINRWMLWFLSFKVFDICQR